MSAAPQIHPLAIGSATLDPCVVETEPLCAILREFVEGWLKTRRSRKGQHGYQDNDVDPLSPYTWLAFDSGLPEDEIRKIRNPSRYPLTELRVADSIARSIGEPLMFYDGTLDVLPNPLSPPEAAAECCGGSEGWKRPVPSVTERSIVRDRQRVVVTPEIPDSLFVRLHQFARGI